MRKGVASLPHPAVVEGQVLIQSCHFERDCHGWDRTSNIQHSTPNVQVHGHRCVVRPDVDLRRWALDAGLLNVGLLDQVGCWLLAVGCWLLVVGCWLLVWTLNISRFSALNVPSGMRRIRQRRRHLG